MQPLHDDHAMACIKVVEAGAHRTVPPVDGRFALRVGFSLVNRVRVIDHADVATLTCSGSNGSDDAVAGVIVLEFLLFVLVLAELEPIAPPLLVPGGFDQRAALYRIADGQRCVVAREDPARLRVVNPDPRGPEDGRQEALGRAWGDVDDQIAKQAFTDGLQVLADGIAGHPWHEYRARFQHVPGLLYEFTQPAPGLLRLQ